MDDSSRDTDLKNQTLTDHLTELRVRIIYSLYFVLGGTLLCWGFSEKIFNVLRAPITPYLPSGGLFFTAPTDKFLAHIKISVTAGVILAAPFWFFQIWKFVAPGLYQKERKYTVAFIFAGTGLMCLGACFSYFVIFPMAFQFLMTFGGDADKPMITIDHYLSFITTTALAFGAAFELPLVLVLLGMMGIISKQFLKDKRRYAIVGLAVISAIITPPDLLSMVSMFIPLWVLYEISILLVGIVEKKRQEKTADF